MFNHSPNLYGREWLAVVFTNKNQQYGAYALRSQSAVLLLRAFFIVVPIFVLAFVVPSILSSHRENEVGISTNIKEDVVLVDMVPQPEKEVLKPKSMEIPSVSSAEVGIVAASKIKTAGFSSNIKVVSDDLVQISSPTSSELEEAVIASMGQEGVIGKNTNAMVENGKGIKGGAGSSGGDMIYDARSIAVYPEFPGGMEAWARYIQRNLKYPSMAQQEGVGGKVYLSFVVEKDGSINDVIVISGIGYGCDEEAVRVIKKSPRWKPGMHNNLPVRVRYHIPISYTITP